MTFWSSCLARFQLEYCIVLKSEQSNAWQQFGTCRLCCHKICKILPYKKSSVLQLFLPHYLDCDETNYLPFFKEFYNTGFANLLDNEVIAVEIVVHKSILNDTLEIVQKHLEMNGPMECAWAEICPEIELERECAEEKIKDAEECDEMIPDLLSPVENICTFEPISNIMPKGKALN